MGAIISSPQNIFFFFKPLCSLSGFGSQKIRFGSRKGLADSAKGIRLLSPVSISLLMHCFICCFFFFFFFLWKRKVYHDVFVVKLSASYRHNDVIHTAVGSRHRPDDAPTSKIQSGQWRLPYAARRVSAANWAVAPVPCPAHPILF